jgi:hypothetical protein
MSTYTRPNYEFKARLVFMADALTVNAQDDRNASILKAIYKIARLAQDYRTVYCDAVKRVMEWERAK